MLKALICNAHFSTGLSHALPYQKSFATSVTQNEVISAIRAGRSVCIAGEPPENYDVSPFFGLFSVLQDEAKLRPKPQPRAIKLFKSIEESYKQYANTTKENSPLRGALVVTPSPDLGIQRYSLLRLMDKENELEISRIVSSLEIYCSVTSVDSSLHSL
eukprot:TRINITY_DN13764_c0_g1_i1.p1 TRINITY_DN13764_c0_g1~~TRINITY_DN13764_c0_g1_i1.p1  ORF type:complete len:159 (-),score=28.84 TRINITY_DN13764_c0_g1_i1:358-834(-)